VHSSGDLLVIVLAALFAGFLCGLLPLKVGMAKGRPGLAVTGMGTCILMGLIGGLLLAGPTALCFTFTILALGRLKPDQPPSLDDWSWPLTPKDR
jgi:hypothetical protein